MNGQEEGVLDLGRSSSSGIQNLLFWACPLHLKPGEHFCTWSYTLWAPWRMGSTNLCPGQRASDLQGPRTLSPIVSTFSCQLLLFFKYFFKNIFYYSYCYFIHFFFFGCAMQHVGSLFPHQESNPCPLYWKHRILTTGLPGKSHQLLKGRG